MHELVLGGGASLSYFSVVCRNRANQSLLGDVLSMNVQRSLRLDPVPKSISPRDCITQCIVHYIVFFGGRELSLTHPVLLLVEEPLKMELGSYVTSGPLAGRSQTSVLNRKWLELRQAIGQP